MCIYEGMSTVRARESCCFFEHVSLSFYIPPSVKEIGRAIYHVIISPMVDVVLFFGAMSSVMSHIAGPCVSI